MNCTPGPESSSLISTEKAVPIKPENNANIRYNVPISFALDDKNHLSSQRLMEDLFKTNPFFKGLSYESILLLLFCKCLNKNGESKGVQITILSVYLSIFLVSFIFFR